MPYGKLKSIAEVAIKFDIEVSGNITFTHEKNLSIIDAPFSMVKENLNEKTNYVSEYAIFNALIRPILDIVTKNNSLKKV